ncbi:hypothetical protein ACJRO7_024938 [Eucalyptus globulus]|uniref:Uncharacterized protein n=1 Tax=Eucalyptus globulus TaxID=34317 RepID=A0ABD3KB48_EUCGL
MGLNLWAPFPITDISMGQNIFEGPFSIPAPKPKLKLNNVLGLIPDLPGSPWFAIAASHIMQFDHLRRTPHHHAVVCRPGTHRVRYSRVSTSEWSVTIEVPKSG